MGRIDLRADRPAHVESLVAYVAMQRPERLFAILTEADELIVRPKVQSRVDSLLITGVSVRVWEEIRQKLNGLGLVLLRATRYAFAEDRITVDP